jgi:hypothetical protein
MPAALNQQIEQLQQQILAKRRVQQQQQRQFRQLLSERLTSWPMLLGALAAGIALLHVSTNGTAESPVKPPIVAAANDDPIAANHPQIEPEPAASSAWQALWHLPLLSQSLYWLLEQRWLSDLFRAGIRRKFQKSKQRQPRY